MKEFDYEAAKNGAPVQARDGKTVRIICWDKKDSFYPIVALYGEDDKEWVETYTLNGKCDLVYDTPRDLVMAPTKKEGWINIYCNKISGGIYDTKEEADEGKLEDCGRVACVHVEWSE